MLIIRVRKTFLLLFLFLLISCNCKSFCSSPEHSVEWGMNAHLTFPCSEKHMEELCKSMAEAGVSIVRLDLYWSPENMLAQRKDFDRAAYYVTKYGMEILLNIPQTPISLNDEEIDKWCDGISYYVKRYSGAQAIDIGDGDIARDINIRFFEIMNEPEQWQRSGLTVDRLFSYIKKSSNAIWRVRKKEDVSIVMPGICNQESFNKQLMAYRDEDGKGINDYIDIWNFHYYSENDKFCWQELTKWKNFFKARENLKEKQIWMTEYGHSLWNCNDYRQGVLLAKQGLIAASLGIDKVFYYQYHQFGGNYFSKDQREDFFGIIDTSIKNSYGSFWRNDGVYKTALSDGNGTRKIYITDRKCNYFSLYTLTESICRELKTNGVAIGGRGYSFDSVILKKGTGENVVLYSGSFTIPQKGRNRVLKFSAGKFKNIDKEDKLVVKVKDVANLYDQWNGVQPLKSYYAYKTLTKELPKGSIARRIDEIDGITIIEWETGSYYRYALWIDSHKESVVTVKNGIISRAVNLWGEKVAFKRNKIRLNEDVVYLESKSKLKFTKN